MSDDTRNAYFQAPTSEKHFIICDVDLHGIENAGKQAMFVRDFYGGKLAVRDFWMHLRACTDTLGFTSWFADPDLWMRMSKSGDVTAYYEYVLLYIDDCLVISDNAQNVIQEEIGKYFKLNQDSIKPPDLYLGANMRQVTLDNVVKAWDFGSSQQVKAAVNNVKEYLKNQSENPLPMKIHMNPLTSNYFPQIDISKELEPQCA